MPRKKATPLRAVKETGGAVKAAMYPNGLVHEVIARRAYDIFEQRGRSGGRDQEDWYEAERQLLSEARQAAG